jgi:hypothetical protein
MPVHPIMIFVAIVMVLVGVFIFQALPNSPWYPEIEIWVWIAYVIVFVIAMVGAYISGNAL